MKLLSMGYNHIMILNVYKEKGWTSFDVVAKVRRLLGKERKVGHTGTLDPLAEGVLVVLTDEDTRRQNEFMNLRKEYKAVIAFGLATPSYDLEFLPVVSNEQLSLDEVLRLLKDTLPKYIGELNQVVPSYSAVKVNGKRLYKEARKGNINKKDLPVKRVSIYDLHILNSSNEKIKTNEGIINFPAVTIKIVCSSGTYVRSLANDLGEELKVKAVLVSLIRTKVGNFNVSDSKKITELKNIAR